MYKFKSILSSIYRHKRRNIISCLLLFSVISIVFCGFYYREYASNACESVTEHYTKQCYISFRDELQYSSELPHLSALDARLNGTSSTDGKPDIFFDIDGMGIYNKPYPVTLEMFHMLGISEYCEAYEIAYAENAYGFAETLPDWIQNNLDAVYLSYGDIPSPGKILTEHIVVGGSLEAFTSIARENTSGFLYDFILKEGSNFPGDGECVITDYYAEVYQKEIGDTIVLYDIYKNPIINLKICGIYSVYATEYYEFVNPQIPRSGYKVTGTDITRDFTGGPDIGTPFDRLGEDLTVQEYSQEQYFGKYFRIDNAMISLIHTNLDTAYYLYGTQETDDRFEERHHFNNYFVSYNLKETDNIVALEAKMKTIFPEWFREEFTIYTFDNSYHTFLRIPQNLLYTAEDLILITTILGLLICLITSLVSVCENGKEIGIYLSMGISRSEIVLKIAMENVIVTGIAALIAAFGGRFIHAFLSKGYTYLEMRGAEYVIQWEGVLFTAVAIVISFILTAVLAGLFICIRSPIKLIRQE